MFPFLSFAEYKHSHTIFIYQLISLFFYNAVVTFTYYIHSYTQTVDTIHYLCKILIIC